VKNLILFIICFVVVILQLSVAGVFFPQQRIPDLSLALMITFVLTLGFKESFKWLLFTGLLIDSTSAAIFGSATLSYFLIGWLIFWIAEIADIRSRKIFFLAALAVFVGFAEVFKDILIRVILMLQANVLKESFGMHFQFFSFDYLLKIIYSILAAFILYYLFRRTSRKFFLEPVRLVKKY
jgi:rod shape-determining protein MreD